jgi:hypothetical protein
VKHLLSDNIVFSGMSQVRVGYIKKINGNRNVWLSQRVGQTLSPRLSSRELQPRRRSSLAIMTWNIMYTVPQCLDTTRIPNIQQLDFPSGRSKELCTLIVTLSLMSGRLRKTRQFLPTRVLRILSMPGSVDQFGVFFSSFFQSMVLYGAYNEHNR